MNSVDPKALRKSRLFLLLIALVFAAPMIVAGLLSWSGWQPGVKGHGEAILPQRNFVDQKLRVQLPTARTMPGARPRHSSPWWRWPDPAVPAAA